MFRQTIMWCSEHLVHHLKCFKGIHCKNPPRTRRKNPKISLASWLIWFLAIDHKKARWKGFLDLPTALTNVLYCRCIYWTLLEILQKVGHLLQSLWLPIIVEVKSKCNAIYLKLQREVDAVLGILIFMVMNFIFHIVEVRTYRYK